MTVLSNSLGAQVLAGAVTPANFAGPPLVALGATLTGSDPRWAAALAFAARFGAAGAPLLGVTGSDGLDAVGEALQSIQPVWSASHGAPSPMWDYGDGIAVHPVLCGPVVLLPSGDEDQRVAAWDWAQSTARSTQYHPYGFGMHAVSSVAPWLSPPIWVADPVNYASTLGSWVNLWRAGQLPTSAQYAALAALEVARPGTSKFYNPCLIGSGLLTTSP